LASALFALSSDDGSTYLDPGVAMADDEALTYVSTGSYSIKARLDSTAGVNTVSWTITSADDEHVDSLPAVTSNADKTASLSVPKTGGTWLLKCVVNGGVSQGQTDPTLTRSLAIKVRNSVGQQEIAVGETTEAGSSGYTKAFNDLARSMPSGVAATGDVLFCDDASVSGASIHDTWSEAKAAALALPGQVTIQILGSTATLDESITLGSKIAVVGVPPSGTSKVTVTVVEGVVLTDATKLSNVALLADNDTASAVTVAGDTVLLLDNTSVQTSSTGNAIAPNDGSSIVLSNGSTIDTGTTEAVVVTGSDAVTIVANDTSSVAQDEIDAGASTAVTLTTTSQTASIGTQAGIAGTVTVQSALEPWLFVLSGCYADPDALPADIDGLRVAEVACRVTKATAFRSVKGAGSSTTLNAYRVNGSGAVSILSGAMSIATSDGDDFTRTTTTFADPTFAIGDRCTVRLTAAESYEDSPEGPADLYVRLDRVKA
jgi:hypothetical protein